MALPAHELVSLGIHDLVLAEHRDGVALHFGPGPEVAIFSTNGPEALENILRARRAAGVALMRLELLLRAPSTEVR